MIKENYIVTYIILYVVSALILGLLAARKNRNGLAWGLVGGLFLLPALLVLMFLPYLPACPATAGPSLDDPRYRHARYYPGFLGALFLVLLRIAIGWHFLYEGIEKIYSTPEGRDSALARVLPRPSKPEPPFSAEGYLRASSGPLAPYFRSLVPDVDSLRKLNLDYLEQEWRADLGRYARHYGYSAPQREEAEKALADREAVAEAWFHDPANLDEIQKYKDGLAFVDRTLGDPQSLSFERERAYERRRELEKDRRTLAATVDAWTGTLHDAWKKLAGVENVEPPPALMTKLDWINRLTMGGMVAVGVGLILGFLTPLSALGAAAYLVLFYLSMPPWPHIPPGPMQEGHYLFVNKNLIELIACLVLASTPNGLWIGLDALLFGRYARRREARRLAREVERARERGELPEPGDRPVVRIETSRKSPTKSR